jgi:hypothetical protein
MVAICVLWAHSVTAQQTVFITDFAPKQAHHGDTITVRGSGFMSSPTPPTHADVGGLPSTPVRVLSDTELEFDVQPHFFTNPIWLRNINANQRVLNSAFSTDDLEILGTPSGPPTAPDQLRTQLGSGSSLDVYWRDNARDEQFYELTIDIGAFGYTTFRLGVDAEYHRVTQLPAGRAYRVEVCAWNQQGKACSDWVKSDIVQMHQPPDPEHNWVRVIDSTVSVQGNPSHVPEPPLAASATENTFRAVEVEAYWDANGNGVVDDHPFPTVMPGATFPLETQAQPPDSQGRTYNTVFGTDYACHAGLNQCANLIVILVIEPTGGQPRDTHAYLAMHYYYDARANMFWMLDVRGGDWQTGAGKTMIWPGNLPSGFAAPTLNNLQLPTSRASNGYVEGMLEVALVFIETFSYFDANGSPAVGTLTYESIVEAEFAVSILTN